MKIYFSRHIISSGEVLEDLQRVHKGPKKKREWVKVREFDSAQEAESFIKIETMWKKCSIKKSVGGPKVEYRCVYGKYRKQECPARIYLMYHTTSPKVTMFSTVQEHSNHRDSMSGLEKDIKGFSSYYNWNLQNKPCVASSTAQVSNYVSTETYSCELCSKTFTVKKKYLRHIRNHKTKRHLCSHCGQSFHSTTGLKHHVSRVHEKKRDVSCSFCDYKGYSKAVVRIHTIQIHTKEYPHKCVTCNKGFICKRELVLHIESIHEGVRFICEICKRIFKYKYYFNQHVKRHSLEKKFACDRCSKRFVYERDLQKHLKLHGVNIRQICDVCGKSVTHIHVHKRIHEDTKCFICDHCGKGFRDHYNLQLHLRVHTGEKPHKCELCEKAFSQHQSLKAHVRLHTKEKPYRCEICTKGFVTKGTLKNHVCRGPPSD